MYQRRGSGVAIEATSKPPGKRDRPRVVAGDLGVCALEARFCRHGREHDQEGGGDAAALPGVGHDDRNLAFTGAPARDVFRDARSAAVVPVRPGDQRNPERRIRIQDPIDPLQRRSRYGMHEAQVSRLRR